MCKKRFGRKIGLSILLIALLLIGCAAYIFRAEIGLVYFAVTTPKEVVQSKQVENDKKTQELLEQIEVQTMRDLTEEERKLLASGELSAADALALIRGETLPAAVETTCPAAVTTAVPLSESSTAVPATELPTPETTAVVTLPEPTATTAATTATTAATTVATTAATTAATTVATTAATTAATTVATTAATTAATTVATTAATTKNDPTALQTRQSEIIAEIYLLRATYLNEIDALIQGMKDEYAALPEEERGFVAKMKIVEKTMPKGNALEDACDAQMAELLEELEEILRQAGASTEIIEEIEKTYLEQKALKKTELYNQYFPNLQK